MKITVLLILFIWINTVLVAQNQNISEGTVFDGEPYLAVNPTNFQHMVVAWMGYVPFNQLAIKTKVSFNGGESWSSAVNIPHINPLFTSADPSMGFDGNGNLFLSYIDFSELLDSGSVFIRKSIDGGLSWSDTVEVINNHSDPNKRAIDRPWISIDRSGGTNDGNIYITTMNALRIPVAPPYHPYFMKSTDGGVTVDPWQYVDTALWLAGSLIPGPMPTSCVSANGTVHVVYPSWVFSQNIYPQYIIASSNNAGTSFSYNSVLATPTVVSDSLAKKGYLIKANPADSNHLVFLYVGFDYGDVDIFITESFDSGINWTTPLRVNDDPIGNNRMQDLVWADFDNDGDLVVSWRDRRNGSDTTYTTSSEIWAAVRWKDSTSFSANFRISSTITAYDTILASAGNDFMCVNLVNDTIAAVWGDTRDGKLNIWFQRITMDGTILYAHKLASEDVPVVSVYPNPTTNSITIDAVELMSVSIFNNTGKLVLKNDYPDRRGKVRLDLKNLSKGNYFLKVVTKRGTKTEKIIVQ